MKQLLLTTLCIALGGCAGGSASIPVTDIGALKSFKSIPNSRAAPCSMQRAVAEHNSVLTTLQSGHDTVYRAPCDVDRPPQGDTPRVVS